MKYSPLVFRPLRSLIDLRETLTNYKIFAPCIQDIGNKGPGLPLGTIMKILITILIIIDLAVLCSNHRNRIDHKYNYYKHPLRTGTAKGMIQMHRGTQLSVRVAADQTGGLVSERF